MATERDVRVGDAERESVAAQLREHYALGRLTMDELNERLDRVFASRTRADLDAVTSDLPYAAPRGVLPSDGAWRGGSGGRGGDYRFGYGRRPAAGILGFIPVAVALWLVVAVVSVLAFGIGSGPPVVAIFLAALAAIRWIFGRGRGRGRCGPFRAARRRR